MLRGALRTFAKFKPDLTAADFLSNRAPDKILQYKKHTNPYMQHQRFEKLQKIVKLHTVTPGLSIPESVMNIAKKDEEFANFLGTFKDNVQPEYNSMLNTPVMTDEEHFEADMKRNAQDRLHELHMYEHYRKAKIVSDVRKKLIEEAKQETEHDEEFEELGTKRLYPRALYDRSQFEMLLLSVGSTTNITRLNRVMKRRCLVFTGNYEGIIGYGLGKGVDYKKAYDSAVRECLNNLIAIPVDYRQPNLVRLIGNHNGVTLKLDPSPPGYLYGNPMVVTMLELAGIPNCRISLKGRNRNIYSIVYSLFQAVTMNQAPKHFAEQTGRKVYELTYGRAAMDTTKRSDSFLYS